MLAVSFQAQLVQQTVLPSLHQLVEDMEVSLSVILMHNPWLLQQVVQNMTSNGIPLNVLWS